jgi:hypothetical protein
MGSVMTGMHGDHAFVEIVAAFVLTLGGAVILVQAWFDHGRREDGIWSVRDTGPSPARLTAALVAVLSGAAAAIHLAAGPEHVEDLGDVGLGFYWAALFQAVFVVAWLVSSRPRWLAWVGIAGNGALIALWLLSRTVGLPVLPGVEPVGTTDAICVAFEVGLVVVLVSVLRARAPSLGGDRSMRLGTTGIVAISSVAVLATAIAVVDVGAGHHAEAIANAAGHLTAP